MGRVPIESLRYLAFIMGGSADADSEWWWLLCRTLEPLLTKSNELLLAAPTGKMASFKDHTVNYIES